jgi:hypothetical protein
MEGNSSHPLVDARPRRRIAAPPGRAACYCRGRSSDTAPPGLSTVCRGTMSCSCRTLPSQSLSINFGTLPTPGTGLTWPGRRGRRASFGRSSTCRVMYLWSHCGALRRYNFPASSATCRCPARSPRPLPELRPASSQRRRPARSGRVNRHRDLRDRRFIQSESSSGDLHFV